MSCSAARTARTAQKKVQLPDQPRLAGLKDAANGDLAGTFPGLISPSVGIVRSLERVHKDLSEPQAPFIYRAELANHRFLDTEEEAFIVTSGKGFTKHAAQVSAMGEAVERYAASSWGEEIVLRGTAASLELPALDPQRLVLFAEDQYPALKYHLYEDGSSLGWCRMTSLSKDQDIAVPALAVLMAYETQGDEPFLFPITSNGLAAGRTLAEAILNGAYECIERDAFLCTWLNRLPATRIDPTDHPDEDVRALVAAYARRGVDLELYRLPTESGVHVFMGVGVNHGPQDGPAVVVGLGADHDPVAAAKSALIEICQVRPSLRVRLRTEDTQARLRVLLEDHGNVEALEDHDLLYADPSMLPAFDFLRNSPIEAFDWGSVERNSVHACLEKLAGDLRTGGTDLLYANLTSADVLPFGAHVARVVIPDYQPMHFGRNERRLAATRLYEMPERLGIGPATTPETLNPYPHPLA